MKRIARALLISLTVLLPLTRELSSASARGDTLADSVQASDSSLKSTRGDSTVLRVVESGMSFGSGELREPTGVAVDSRGFVYVADAMAGKVFRYSQDGSSLEFQRPPNGATFYPIDVAVQEAFILVLDYSRNSLLRYDCEGSYLDVLISFDQFDRMRPVSITSGPGGRFITTDVASNTVVLWTPLVDIELEIGEFGQGDGRFNEPRKAAFLPNQGFVVVESGNRRMQLFSPSGRHELTVRQAAGVDFVSPRSLSVDDAGVIFVCDSRSGRISAFSPDGAYLAAIDSYSGHTISPAATASTWDGALYVADLKSRSILVYRLLPPREK
ncbi:MAG: NHL repeat-containing protein [Candidatus Krumholzibacteria bacterium]|nr:NHL repeat-containing protein [Candidatus Krumholzibacteria bacterium]